MNQSARLCLIVAAAKNNVIGLAGKMPWHLPAELAYFKRVTMGQPIIMGRKTFDAIGRVLPGRRNIVVTRNRVWRHEGVEVAHGFAEAMAMVGDSSAFVIGGATLYAEALPHVEQIYLTRVDAEVEGDTFFPALPASEWQEVSREHRPKDAQNIYDMDFVVLARRST